MDGVVLHPHVLFNGTKINPGVPIGGNQQCNFLVHDARALAITEVDYVIVAVGARVKKWSKYLCSNAWTAMCCSVFTYGKMILVSPMIAIKRIWLEKQLKVSGQSILDM